jgi:hypothetical protein
MIAETILHVAKDLFGVFARLNDARLRRKDTVASYLGDLAQTIEDTRASLARGVYPHGRCEELRVHAENMKAVIGDLIGDDLAGQYAAKVLQVWEIERMPAELLGKDEAERERQLHLLDQAAGHFRATAAHIRAAP